MRTRTTISPKAKEIKQKFLDVLWDAYNEPSTTSTGVSNKSLKQKFPHYSRPDQRNAQLDAKGH